MQELHDQEEMTDMTDMTDQDDATGGNKTAVCMTVGPWPAVLTSPMTAIHKRWQKPGRQVCLGLQHGVLSLIVLKGVQQESSRLPHSITLHTSDKSRWSN
jgi:hypothetical protein